jgi:hypothetical protein
MFDNLVNTPAAFLHFFGNFRVIVMQYIKRIMQSFRNLKNTVQNDLNVEEFHLQKCFEVKTVVL